MKKAHPKSMIEVFVRAGIYELTKPFKLAAEDSGTKDGPVVYLACPAEKVVLVGGRRITGFTPHQGSILNADVDVQGFHSPLPSHRARVLNRNSSQGR